MIAIRSLPSLPSPKYTERDENEGETKRFGMMFSNDKSFPEDVDSDMDDDKSVSPPPQYAAMLEVTGVPSFRDVKGKTEEHDVSVVRGLELGLDAREINATAFWPHVTEGIYVVQAS